MPDNLTYKKLNSFDDNAKFFYQYFIQKGFSPVASAGIVGNLIQESTGGSGVDTNVTNSIGAFGAAQWLNTRKTDLFNFAKRLGVSPSDRRAQAEFLIHELNTTHTKARNALMNAKTVDEATNSFLVHFEKPAKHEYVLDKRINYAKSVLPTQPKPNSFWYDNVQVGKNTSGLKDNAFAVMSILKNKFPSLKITSTVRKASQGVGKNSKTSRHNIGEAFDISGEHKDVYDYLNTYEGVNLLNKYGLGVLDETDPETMKKTGATGAHYHIGADSKLVANTRAKLTSFGANVMNQPVEQDTDQEEYNGFKPTDNDLSNSYILASLDSLNEKLNKQKENEIVNMRNQEMRNSLLQKQQEKDFLVAQVLSVNLPFVERGY